MTNTQVMEMFNNWAKINIGSELKEKIVKLQEKYFRIFSEEYEINENIRNIEIKISNIEKRLKKVKHNKSKYTDILDDEDILAEDLLFAQEELQDEKSKLIKIKFNKMVLEHKIKKMNNIIDREIIARRYGKSTTILPKIKLKRILPKKKKFKTNSANNILRKIDFNMQSTLGINASEELERIKKEVLGQSRDEIHKIPKENSDEEMIISPSRILKREPENTKNETSESRIRGIPKCGTDVLIDNYIDTYRCGISDDQLLEEGKKYVQEHGIESSKKIINSKSENLTPREYIYIAVKAIYKPKKEQALREQKKEEILKNVERNNR